MSTTEQPRKASKQDVALAQAEAERAQASVALRRMDNWSKAIRGSFRVLYIVSAGVPIYAMHTVIAPLAGKTTSLQVGVALTAVASISIAGNAFAIWRASGQKKTINRLRAREDVLEDLVLKSKKETDDN